MRNILALSLFLLVIQACKPTQKASGSPDNSTLVPDGKIWSSLFQQRAAEYDALCIQAFNLARWRLDEATKQRFDKRPAIVTDIDETFLDNSPYAVHQALKGQDYTSETWREWTAKGVADTLTGALSFFNYAASLGIEVFYITNRDEAERAGTLKNLQDFKFPFADNLHLIMRQSSSSKETRREAVAAHYSIVLLLGDNLADFSSLFDKKTEAERSAAVQQLSGQFGKKFIVLPNTNYGGWEDAVYGNRHDLTPAQKDSAIRSTLKAY